MAAAKYRRSHLVYGGIMAFFSKKKASAVQEPMDLESVMKKFDRESNTRIWEGKAKIVVTFVLAVFSLFCIYVTLLQAGLRNFDLHLLWHSLYFWDILCTLHERVFKRLIICLGMMWF